MSYVAYAIVHKILVNVLSGRGDAIDFDTLVRLGWWDSEKGYVSSTLLLNEALHSEKCLVDMKG